jgi:hypothetical protein
VAQQVFLYQSDNVLEVSNLKNADANEYLNSATVECTLVDSKGVLVQGQTWPLTLTYVASSNGRYKATLSYALVLIPNKMYTARITAAAGPGLRRYWEMPLLVKIA